MLRSLSRRTLAAAVLVGLAAGVGGVFLTLLLHLVQHLSFGYPEGAFLQGVERAGRARRVVALLAGGVVTGVGWWLFRRRAGEHVSVTGALAIHDRDDRQDVAEPPRLPLREVMADAVLQIVAVGAGASLGREGAPRQVGAALGAWVGGRMGLSPVAQRVLLACGAGAGLAAVYNVPLAGAVFTLEALLATAALSAAVPALVTAVVATVVAWPVLGDRPTYTVPGGAPFSLPVLAWSLLAGPAAGLLGTGVIRLATVARTHAARGTATLLAIPAVFTALGALATVFPQLLGNGKGMAQLAFDGTLGLGLALALTVLKPIATAACLGAGAIGGLLTPSLATGAAFGALTGGLWAHVWPGGAPASFAVVGAAAVLAAAQRTPLTAVVLVVELTRTGLSLLPVTALAVALAVLTARGVRRFSGG